MVAVPPIPADGSPVPGLPPLVDTHCHLAWDALKADIDDVVARARAVGVEQMVVVATDSATAEASADICNGRPGLFPTTGIHPNDVPEDFATEWARIETQARSGRFVAIGETGLDTYRDAVPLERQQVSFLAHARLARELDLPVIVHIRDREGSFATYSVVAELLGEVSGVRGVIHCYTGDAAHAQRYLDLGFHVSFSGILTFPKGENVREAARLVPIERALVETDAPFLAPVPHRGARNEPAYVAATARRLAEIKGLSEADVRRITTRNARALFRLPDPSAAG